MPQDFGYRDSDSSAPINDSMHQPRRSYDGNMASAIPVKRMMSFGGLDSDSMVGAATPSEVSAVWDAPPSGIEKENEAFQFLRTYEEKRPEAPVPSSPSRSLKDRDANDDKSTCSTYSHSELDDDASDVSSSLLGSMRRRNRISQMHAQKLLQRQHVQKMLQRQHREKREKEKRNKKKPLGAKTSINEVKPRGANLKPSPKRGGLGSCGKSEATKAAPLSMESKLQKVADRRTTALFRDTDSSSASASTNEKSHGPLAPTSKRSIGSKFKFDDPSSSSVITKSSANSNSPDRSVATNWTNSTYSTVGSGGRVYRTKITCSGKYKGRVMDKVVVLDPDDLQIGRKLEGLENGFLEVDDFAHALINALFNYDMKKEPLHKLKNWETTKATLSRLEKDNEEKTTTETAEEKKEVESTSDTTTEATSVSEESAPGAPVEVISPPTTKRITTSTVDNVAKSPLLPNKEEKTGDVRFLAEKTASLQYKDVYGMASAKGILHFFEDRDEIWIEEYNFCFASRRFKFLSG
ncbi:MAG: hypothetical protein SGBAC_003110 [Bacillariaceae sp.]